MLIPMRSLRAGVLALIAAAGVLQGSPAMGSGVIQQVTVKPFPSLPGKPWTFTTYYGVFSAYDGTPVNSSFTHKINGLKKPEIDPDNNGGHFHYTNRPLSLQNKPLQHDGDRDPDPFGVAGFTSLDPSQRWGKVVHEMPEVSGNIVGEATVVLPYRWYCVDSCYTSNSWRYEWTYDIGIRELANLPNIPSEYAKVRTRPDFNHPDSVAFTGTQFALQMLPLIAQNYFVLSGRLLSVNDMSLIKGGLFDIDINAQWTTPHSSHREGKDADINQDGIGCDQDRDLRTAVDQLLRKVKTPSGNLRSALLCEPCPGTGTNCRKHIDLEFP